MSKWRYRGRAEKFYWQMNVERLNQIQFVPVTSRNKPNSSQTSKFSFEDKQNLTGNEYKTTTMPTFLTQSILQLLIISWGKKKHWRSLTTKKTRNKPADCFHLLEISQGSCRFLSVFEWSPEITFLLLLSLFILSLLSLYNMWCQYELPE